MLPRDDGSVLGSLPGNALDLGVPIGRMKERDRLPLLGLARHSVHGGDPAVVRPLREEIAVSATPEGVTASHTFDLWGVRILELRYGIPLAG